MNATLSHPVAGTRNTGNKPIRSSLDIRHLLIGPCGTHSLKANGVYQVARALADEQIAAGEHARLILLREADTINPDEDSDPNLKVELIDGPKVLGKRVGLSRIVLDALTKDATGQTVFHIHAARQPLLIPLALALRKRDIPYVITVHGRYSHLFDEDAQFKRKLPELYLKTAERWVLEHARFVQAVAPAEQIIISSVAPKARIELVANAAFSSRTGVRAPLEARRERSAKFPVFGFLGRYEIEHKGLDLLLEGFASYRATGGKGTLELVGSGPQRQQLAKLSQQMSLQDSITIDGPRYGDDKVKTILGWDYFVSPSRFDGLPLATLEAAYLGVPVLVTTETGLKARVLGARAGIGIDTLSADAVAAAMHNAENINPQQWSDMSAAAVEMASSIGDWTKISEQIVKLYQKP